MLSTFRNIKLIMFTSLQLAEGAGGVELEVGWRSVMFDKKCHE